MIRVSSVKTQAARTRHRYDYTKGSIGWGITRLSVPMCVEQIIRNFDSILEVFWIGMLGPKFLAATSLGFMTVLFLRSFGFGIRVAGQAMVAQRIGAGDAEGASVFAGQSLLVLGVYSLVFSVLGIYFFAAHYPVDDFRPRACASSGRFTYKPGFQCLSSGKACSCCREYCVARASLVIPSSP